MSENIPQTREEIAAALLEAREASLRQKYGDSFDAQASAVLRWREAWLRDAEPRLRPVTETPQIGDAIIALYEDASPSLWKWKSNGNRAPIFGLGCTGWYLLKRGSVPLTHEQALRLLVVDIRSLGSPPEQLLVALAKAEEALGTKP